jgi:hypothetical protein
LEAIKGKLYKGYSDYECSENSTLDFNSNVESLVSNMTEKIGVIQNSSF